MSKKLKKENNLYVILLRYILIVIFGLGNLFIFYFIFTPLTIYPVYFILSNFYQVSLNGISILVNNFNNLFQIDLVEACIAGAAYYLLFMLNLSTSMSIKKRIYSLSFAFFSLLVLNIIRIIILSFLFVNKIEYFDITHKLFWYAISTIFVVAIWFISIKLFSIKNIPVYSDFKEIYKNLK